MGSGLRTSSSVHLSLSLLFLFYRFVVFDMVHVCCMEFFWCAYGCLGMDDAKSYG